MDVAARFREYARLDRQRSREGLCPAELERWTQLKRLLSRRFSPDLPDRRLDQRSSLRVPTRLAVALRTSRELHGCLMTNVSRGGLFVATEQPAPIGTRLTLYLQIEETSERVEVPAEVASVDVGPDLASEQRGMGLRFLEMDGKTRAKIDAFYESRLRAHGRR